MARERLTDRRIAAMKPPGTGRKQVFDTIRTGLCFRITAKGARSWSLMYRFRGELRRDTLGSYPLLPLAQARKLAVEAQESIGLGKDPREARAAVDAELVQRETDTVEAIAGQFIAKHASLRRWGELKRVLERDVVPRWAGRTMASIARRDVRELVEDVAERAPVQANRTLTVLRIFFRWAAKRDIVQGDPTAGVDKTEEKPRTRKFSDQEIMAFWRACDRLGWPFGDCFKLLLVTGARKAEIADGHWAEIDETSRIWDVPAERVKNKQPHVMPLSNLSLAIINGLKRIGDEPDLIFTTNAKAPISGFSKAKTQLDNLMLEELRCGVENPECVQLEPWRIHDLRRVVRSSLGKLGVSSDIAERVLGHAIGGIRKVYDAYEYLDEKRVALDKWAAHLAEITQTRPGDMLCETGRVQVRKAEQSTLPKKRGRPVGSRNKSARARRREKQDADMLWVMNCYREEYGITAPETIVKMIQHRRPDIQIGHSKIADMKRLARKAALAAKN